MYKILFHYNKEAIIIFGIFVLVVGVILLLWFLSKKFNIQSDTKTEANEFAKYYEKVLNSDEHKVKGRSQF